MLEETARSSTFRHRPRAIILSECNLTSISRYCAKTSPWKQEAMEMEERELSKLFLPPVRERGSGTGDRCPVNEVTSHGE